jgi:hypothetical protein
MRKTAKAQLLAVTEHWMVYFTNKKTRALRLHATPASTGLVVDSLFAAIPVLPPEP